MTVTMSMSMKRNLQGFTLVELSVALVALGLLLLGAMAFWQQSMGARVAAVQQEVQWVAKDALLGFLHANYRLPCPAVDAQGIESCAGAGGSLRQVGFVPWRTLDLPRPETGKLRYGVYREASGTGHLDRDLASATDRMNPLRVRTPSPEPKNNDAPNHQAPPLPLPSTGLLGATQSAAGDPLEPLSSFCDAADTPPCPAGGPASVNLVDVCLALNTASELSTPPLGQLGVKVGSARRAVAFVVVAPGLLDADGDGLRFDEANAKATDLDPTFESAGRAISHLYDDQVVAMSTAELFSYLNCASGLVAVSHAHFDTAIGAFAFERALYDYRDQLYISVKLADADIAAAAAGVLSAVAGVSDATQATLSATADSIASMGARSGQIGMAAAGVVAAVAGGIAAGVAMDDAVASLADAKETHQDFADRTEAATGLSRAINRNALLADAIGF